MAQEPAAKQHPANRLARETSPYLLLHAHNPVDWYPWGPEAFAKAKAENKPIFLSVGYSSCYWCHVMERESFMDAEIAKFLNEHFVCIKVDREERPDVDQVYMAALQAFGTRRLADVDVPDCPTAARSSAATYLPPRDREGFAGFLTVLDRVAKAWRDERAEIEKAADRPDRDRPPQARQAPATAARPRSRRDLADRGPTAARRAVRPRVRRVRLQPRERPPAQVPRAGEPRLPARPASPRRQEGQRPEAGPSSRPGQARSATRWRWSLFTLDHMARGGIRDQLAGGYHRYATSRYWIVPHFEKMLYDNAQLASVHLLAFELTGDPRWRRRGRGHLRVHRPDHDLPRRRLLLGPRRRDRRRGRGVLRLDPRRGEGRPGRGARLRGVRPGLRPEARAQLRGGPLRPARAPARAEQAESPQDDARGARGAARAARGQSCSPPARSGPRRCATTRS